ncbi:MAG: methyltransferase domain-containing protein [Bacteroidetes bacterium]|nr:methyltransferase domain-containing protein [Bacteroidota bacterium]
MNLITRATTMIRSGLSTDHYYEVMNNALKKVNNDDFTMLHYPLFIKKSDTFLQAQENLTDHCISRLDSLENKTILEIGCGNGVQAKYILNKFNPKSITGIDLNQENIRIANQEKDRRGMKNVHFFVDDAQQLSKFKENSIDVIINIESAFHYPDKPLFLKQLFRVLKPGGHFLIADILTTHKKKKWLKKSWKKKMVFHHWDQEKYEKELANARLKITRFEDITSGVTDGFRNYRIWLKEMKKGGFLEDRFYKLFYIINARLNIYLLRTKRQYCIFSGTK